MTNIQSSQQQGQNIVETNAQGSDKVKENIQENYLNKGNT